METAGLKSFAGMSAAGADSVAMAGLANNEGLPRRVNQDHDPVAVATDALILLAPNRKRTPGRNLRR